MIREGAVASMAGKPLWLQLVGTGVTAAFTLHLGAVIEGATWPAVTCHELHSISVLNDPVEVKDGHSKVPDGPGLGVRPNLDIINERQIEKSDANPDPPRLIKTDIPGGEDLYFANYEPQMKESARNGEFPYFPSGIDTRVIPDDGSDRWQQLHDKATESPPVIE